MSKIKVNTLREMWKVLYSRKKNRMLWKETGLENKNKRKKSVKWLCDEIKEITYTGEQQQKYTDENRKRLF